MGSNNVDKVSSNLFLIAEDIKATPYDWDGMPEFVQNEENPHEEVVVRFRNQEDLEEFAKMIDQANIVEKSKRKKSVWYPKLDRNANTLMFWMGDE